jgi:hypothetical protein
MQLSRRTSLTVLRGIRCRASIQPPMRSPAVTEALSEAWLDLRATAPTYLRHALEQLTPIQQTKVAGVSFEQVGAAHQPHLHAAPGRSMDTFPCMQEFRQKALSKMVVGQPVMLHREPWNQYDPRAVRVLTLSGAMCGYIPKAQNPAFQEHELVFARVNFIGRPPGASFIGFNIRCQPTLLSAFVSPFPWSILPGAAGVAPAPPPSSQQPVPTPWEAAMEAALGPQRWNQLSMEAWQRAKGVCEVTGVPPKLAPLELVPLWRFNEAEKMVQVCPH